MEQSKAQELYDKLLDKFYADPDIIDLLEACIVNDAKEREEVYRDVFRYPDRRCLVSKLITDLEIRKKDRRIE